MKTHTVSTTPVNGLREYNQCILIPYGAANESRRGLAHLFEHILINRFGKTQTGYTSHDYIVVYSTCIMPEEEIIRAITSPVVSEELEKARADVLGELYGIQSTDPNYMLWNAIWDNIDKRYAVHPAGCISSVENTGIAHLRSTAKHILAVPIFLYSRNRSSRIFSSRYRFKANIVCRKHASQRITKLIIRNMSASTICEIFDTGDDTPLLLHEYLRLFNPGERTQFLEVKGKKLLLYNINCIFKKDRLQADRHKVYRELYSRNATFPDRFANIALRELLSLYYYDLSWDDRIRHLRDIDSLEVAKLHERVRNIAPATEIAL